MRQFQLIDEHGSHIGRTKMRKAIISSINCPDEPEEVFQEMTAQRTEVRRLIAKKPEQEIEYQ
jgi:hypothetical protein